METAVCCGVCDSCLALKSLKISTEEFNRIAGAILDCISIKKLSAEDLLLQLQSIKKEKLWQVLAFLQTEKKIRADENGLLS